MTINVTRKVSHPIEKMLWGRAAVRCEFAGCNHPLWKSPVTQEQVNVGQGAHIYSFSNSGPRGNKGIPRGKINDPSNLILVCHVCHRVIDRDRDGGRYPATLLQQFKKEHEDRIELATSIAPNRRSHILLYGANIGVHKSPISYNLAAEALFPEWYPADDRAIELSMIDSSDEDHEKGFWLGQEGNLKRKFRERVSERLAAGEIRHLSVFAVAPQPLLMKLGSLLTDIPNVEVRQLQREPQDWKWRKHPPRFRFVVGEPKKKSGPPALVLTLSAEISDDRVTTVLGKDVAIWRVTIKEPNNDFLRSGRQLQQFRELARRLMVRIKDAHGQDAVLSIFPAAPVAIAVELGRIRMPKADLKWRIYDQSNRRGGFIHALDIA